VPPISGPLLARRCWANIKHHPHARSGARFVTKLAAHVKHTRIAREGMRRSVGLLLTAMYSTLPPKVPTKSPGQADAFMGLAALNGRSLTLRAAPAFAIRIFILHGGGRRQRACRAMQQRGRSEGGAQRRQYGRLRRLPCRHGDRGSRSGSGARRWVHAFWYHGGLGRRVDPCARVGACGCGHA
jgi:hypothetical protein